MTKWDYFHAYYYQQQLRHLNGEDVSKEERGMPFHTLLKSLGSRGWELVSFTDTQGAGQHFFFKRPIAQ